MTKPLAIDTSAVARDAPHPAGDAQMDLRSTELRFAVEDPSQVIAVSILGQRLLRERLLHGTARTLML